MSQCFSHRVMFYALVAVGALAAIPCLLYAPTQALRIASRLEQRELSRLHALKSELARQEQLSEAYRSDPQVNARLAQRELGYTRPGHEEPTWRIAQVITLPQEIAAPPAKDLPYAGLLSQYPPWFLRVYSNQFNRIVILCMSFLLMLYAAVLYRAKPGESD